MWINLNSGSVGEEDEQLNEQQCGWRQCGWIRLPSGLATTSPDGRFARNHPSRKESCNFLDASGFFIRIGWIAYSIRGSSFSGRPAITSAAALSYLPAFSAFRCGWPPPIAAVDAGSASGWITGPHRRGWSLPRRICQGHPPAGYLRCCRRWRARKPPKDPFHRGTPQRWRNLIH